MIKVLERASNNISISNFFEEYTVGKYNMDPPYQRRSVWSVEKKAFFIDSILKNLPIPPVFLRQNIDDVTGKTTYEVIDGKQRLSSIIEFIQDFFPTADETEDHFHDEELAGKNFSELDGDYLSEYKKMFWRYQIPVEYVDSEDPVVIDKIFDRLNRNGEPLTGQELRHSNYYDSPFIKLSYDKTKVKFWNERLETTDKARMEDVEFVSELLFTLILNSELTSTNDELDALYAKYANAKIDWVELNNHFDAVTNFMSSLDLHYEDWRIRGVSHLYGIWCFSMKCIALDIDYTQVKTKLHEFFHLTLEKKLSVQDVSEYKQSMSNRTKFKGQRKRRNEAILNFCGIKT